MSEPRAEALFPLSTLQEGLLFNHLYANGPGPDIEQILGTLPEALDIAVFERAWQHLIARHAMLRTAFHWEGLDAPRQVVQPQVAFALDRHDWRDVPAAEQAVRLETLRRAERRRGFDLTAAPLLRVALIQRGERDFQFVWTLHHLLTDARSYVILLTDLFASYEQFRGGTPLVVAEAPAFRRFAEWQRSLDLVTAEKFWRATLAGFSTPTPLPCSDGDAPAAPGEDGCGEHEVHLAESVTAALRALGQRHGFTLNTCLQGAWALLLHHCSGADDVVFGAIRAGRKGTVPDADAIVGPFINTVPVRVRIDHSLPVTRWLGQLRQQWVALRDHEHTPLTAIHGWSEVPGELPLFDTLFNFQDPPWDALLPRQGGAWPARAWQHFSQPTYPLELDASGGPTIRLRLFWKRRHFTDAFARQLLERYKVLLEAIATQPDRRLSELPWLSAAEQRALVADGCGPEMLVPAGATVAELFAAQAAQRPDAVAVRQGGGSWSYGELDRKSNQLARQLEQFGARPETLVGVCLERSFEMVVALLAILKSGAAYLPLDPAYPAARLEFMLADSGARLLVTRASLAARWRNSGAHVVCLDRDAATIAAQSAASVRCPATPGNLCYVIYTSGSTGQPKGVLIEHRALINYCTVAAQAYALTAADRFLQFASLSFDASAEEIFAPLLRGATVVLRTETMADSGAEFLRACRDWGVTVVSVPTVYWHELAPALAGSIWPAAVRLVICGGERALPGPLAAWQRHAPRGVRLLNSYGPTEATVAATLADVSAGACDAPPGREVPIGRALANYAVLIVDGQGRPVPAGVTGELCVTGVSLARGYLGRPELTAEKFGPHPFSSQSGARLYRTGDRARQRADGQIECAGRTDEQVKIRGVRLEPGEIETVLSAHPAVAAAAVVARGAPEQRLVAYIVTRTESTVTAETLREHVRVRLAEPMIPAAFVFLPALPHTPNGKIDRRALPEPTPEQRSADTKFVTPRGPVEEVLARIWEEVLGREPVGVTDNFFALGGHSLLATRVVSQVRDTLDFELPLRRLFETPTVAGLVAAMLTDPVAGHRLTTRAALVLKLSQLSDEEVERMFAKPTGDGQK